jgi:hypothetical protein
LHRALLFLPDLILATLLLIAHLFMGCCLPVVVRAIGE